MSHVLAGNSAHRVTHQASHPRRKDHLMGSIESFLPGLATGSAAVNTGSQVVDGGGDLAASVLGFFGDIVKTVTETLGS